MMKIEASMGRARALSTVIDAVCPPGRLVTAGPASSHNGGVKEPEIRVRPIEEGDRPMLAWLVAELWGSETVAVHGSSLRPAELGGFIAERSRRVAGLLTYQLVGTMAELRPGAARPARRDHHRDRQDRSGAAAE